MGSTKRTTNVSEPTKRKRRRRNVRTADVSSSSSSSDSSSSDREAEISTKSKKKTTKSGKKQAEEVEEVEMEDAPPIAAELELELEELDEEEETINPAKAFTEKSGRIPSPLRDLHDPQADTRFEEYYMRLLTSEFGEELNSVRMAKDFGDKSLPMLVRALKQGVNIFDPEERRIAVAGVAGAMD